MRTVSVRSADLPKVTIPIGYVGENLYTKVIIDCKKDFDEHPDAVVGMTVEPPEGDAYPAIVTRDGDFVVWDVSASDLVYRGSGSIQISFTIDGTIVGKTPVGRIMVNKSIVPDGEAPTALDDFLTRASTILNEIPDDIDDALEEAKASGEFDGPPGEDGVSPTVTIQDIAGGHRITITDAEGPHSFDVMDGQGGGAAIDDESTAADKVWSAQKVNGVKNTAEGKYSKPSDGIPSSDMAEAVRTSLGKADTAYQKPVSGIPGTDLATGVIPDPTSIIDDTSEAENKVWSAKESASLKRSIDKLTPDATASDVGKAIIVKTVENGKPSSYEYGEAGGGSVDPSAIAQAVDDWCDENITNPDSPPLDRSLTSSSAAAPADIAGGMSNELNMQNTTKNLLATATKHTGKQLDNNGEIATLGNNDVFEIAYDGSYSTFNATLYNNTNYNTKAISFQNNQGTVISTLTYPSTSSASTYTDQTIPAGTATILLNNKRSSGDPSCTCPSKYSKRLSDIEEDIATNSNVRSALIFSTKNLFDISTANDNYLIDNANGNMSAQTGHVASDWIEIEASTVYTISAKTANKNIPSTSGLRYAFYNSSKTYISGAQLIPTFRTPSTAKYIRFSLTNTLVNIQLERRSFATKYAPHNAYVTNDESDTMFFNYPAKLYAVTGLEYNLYTFNVTPERYNGEFEWYYRKDSTKLNNYERFIRLQSSNSSTSKISVIAEAKSLTKYGEKEFDIVVKNPSNLQNVSVIVLGDSTTANGYVVSDLHTYSGNENKISTLGTCGTSPNNHEGRLGWTLNKYFTESTNNPFYNPVSETFDAQYYFTNSGVSVPDIFIINLGINDMFASSDSLYDAKATADDFIDKVNAVITGLHTVSATMKIAICLTIPPNVNSYAFGAAGINSINYDQYRIANLVLGEKLIDAFDYRENEYIYLLPINAVLDTKYNMATEEQYPNSRASAKVYVPTTSADVHPDQGGYYQIADEMYAFICSLYVT